jgi:hypothetical protein
MSRRLHGLQALVAAQRASSAAAGLPPRHPRGGTAGRCAAPAGRRPPHWPGIAAAAAWPPLPPGSCTSATGPLRTPRRQLQPQVAEPRP